MPISAFPLNTITDRLAATCIGNLDSQYRSVERAANSQAALNEGQFAMPACFVLEPHYSREGEPNGSAELVQLTVVEIGVLTAISNYQGTAGNLQSEQAEAVRNTLYASLVGFRPESGGYGIDLGSGGLFQIRDQVFYYLDTFRLYRRVRGAAPL